LDLVEKEAEKGNVILIRPSKDLKVKRTESDVPKIERLYELGKEDAAKLPFILSSVQPDNSKPHAQQPHSATPENSP
jgi:predicted patatin/cPLA2 family phospholipase